ncbi:class I SAM-dependent methyltransferase [Actinocrispum sp. NPDC049592]|uniref:class I SAM-dependent methyltransferase n=1 Tax=Actinocrispum sp. NPDC049592 TaxID=3154835 RepID=UPI00342444C4
MEHDVSNLLYRHPEWYESVYDGAGHAAGRLAETQFQAVLGRLPASLLDIGCGTGRDLEYLAALIPDVVGVDYQQTMIDYARAQRPGIDFRTGDMRTLRLHRTFEAITSFGLALTYIHDNHDIDRVMTTYATHSVPGTVLILETLDPGKLDLLPARFTIPAMHATADAVYRHHPGHQLLERTRVWRLDGEYVRDSVRFRVLYPQELAHYLDRHGFELLGTHTVAGEKTAASMFVVAQYRGEA